MAQEGANAVRRFGREDVFEPASLLGDLPLIVHMECSREQAFGQSMAANNVLSPLASLFGEDDHALAVADGSASGTKCNVTAVENLFVSMRPRCVLG